MNKVKLDEMQMRLPLELIDAVYKFADIDTKLILRKVLPHFRFTHTSRQVDTSLQSRLRLLCYKRRDDMYVIIGIPIRFTGKRYVLYSYINESLEVEVLNNSDNNMFERWVSKWDKIEFTLIRRI